MPMAVRVRPATEGSLRGRPRAHLGGLVEEAAAASLLEEAQILVYTAAGELPGQEVPGENTLNGETLLGKMTGRGQHNGTAKKLEWNNTNNKTAI